MKLGFFGGSFNPPTVAHYSLVKQAIEEYDFDKVYFVPVNNLYSKDNLISIDDRIHMLELLCQENNKMLVSRLEKENNVAFKAIDIFRLIKKVYQGNEIVFFMGEDNFCRMPQWKDYDELKKYNYIVFQRCDNSEKKIFQKNVIYMKNNESMKISSTIIRNRLKYGEPINGLVNDNIEKYIIEKRLYLKEVI